MGNRRTANVRSKGYSDLFSLNKDDLWQALHEYPEAKRLLLSVGKGILAKDGMIDEEKAKREEAAKMTVNQKVAELFFNTNGISTKMTRLTEDFKTFQKESLQKLTILEKCNDKNLKYNK